MAEGDRAYIAYYHDGIRVLDISDPTKPAEIAHYNTWSADEPRAGRSFYEGVMGLDLDLNRGLIYVADSERDLLILQLQE